MFRNQYDNDIATWSPQGRLHQIEYALEAVKQGSAAVGLCSNEHIVLLALKRSAGELASYQKKILKIDDHIGIAIVGLLFDARVLSKYMRLECMRQRIAYKRPYPSRRLVGKVADRAQINTQRYGRRPYGVGLLVAAFDEETGPHLYELLPSATFSDYLGTAIGARSQSARTYLERNLQSFGNCQLDELIRHGLLSLRDTLQQDKELNTENLSIGIVGKDRKFEVLEGEATQKYLDLLSEAERVKASSRRAEDKSDGDQLGTSAPQAGGQGEPTGEPEPMDTE